MKKSVFIWILLHIVAAMLILAVTWPWVLHFNGEFLNHWDPPFHAWKLEFMARRILAGDPFFVSRETTLFYPTTGTLYFEALQWPASMLAAILFAVTNWSPEFIYHVILIFFWSLSAPCMNLFLKCFGIGQLASATISIIFCILPYRISYANEFQMQFAFAIPLFYLALARFFKKSRVVNGVLLALSWWIFAVLDLNMAIFILFTVPMISLAYLSKYPEKLCDRKFWISCAAGVGSGILSLMILLFPYLQQKSGGSVLRPIDEVVKHSIQPLSYFKPFGRFHLFDIDAKVEEFLAYPTLVLFILSSFAAGVWWFKSARLRKENPGRDKIAPLALAFSIFSFAIISILFQNKIGIGVHELIAIWCRLPVLCFLLAICFCFSGNRSHQSRFMIGMFASAIFCYFLSLGPVLGLGHHFFISVDNKLYMFLYENLSILTGFRAACRFGVFVHFFMLCASAFALQYIFTRINGSVKSHRLIGVAMCSVFSILLCGLVFIESIPTSRFLRFQRIDNMREYPVTKRLAERKNPFVIAMFPMAWRGYQGMMIFSLLKDDYPSLYAWGGFYPEFATNLRNNVDRGNADIVAENMSAIWPECLILVDRLREIPAKELYADAHPDHIAVRSGKKIVDYVGMFSDFADEEDSDNRFTLLKIRPSKPSKEQVKIFRSDFARNRAQVFAKITGTPGSTVKVLFNGTHLADATLRETGDECLLFDIPKELVVITGYNKLLFTSSDNISVYDFSLERADIRCND